jgi:hypothetical protein
LVYIHIVGWCTVHIHIVGWCTVHIHIAGWCTVHIHIVGWCAVHIHIVGWCTMHIHIVGCCTVHIHIVGWCTVHIHIVGWCTVHTKLKYWSIFLLIRDVKPFKYFRLCLPTIQSSIIWIAPPFLRWSQFTDTHWANQTQFYNGSTGTCITVANDICREVCIFNTYYVSMKSIIKSSNR